MNQKVSSQVEGAVLPLAQMLCCRRRGETYPLLDWCTSATW
jgi:hypothetical protein